MLAVIDRLWVEHLTEMDDLREGVGLQAYGQTRSAGRLQDRGLPDVPAAPGEHIQHDVVHTHLPRAAGRGRAAGADPHDDRKSRPTANRERQRASPITKKIGPNDKCFCGSGKKYKFCHGAAAGKRKIAQEANSPS